MQKIGIIAESFGRLSSPFQTTSQSIMKSSGYNIGNWAFWNATNTIINKKSILIPGRPKVENYINNVDILIIPAANWLQSRYDFSWLADFIEGINKPCIMIGLGAQSHNENIIPPLKEGTIRMLQAVSSRTPYIGVRGDYTKKVCLQNNIHNIKVMGCPSLFTNSSPKLGQSIAKKWYLHGKGKTIIHASMFPENVKPIEQWLFDYLLKSKGTTYVIQAPQALIKPLFQEELNENEIAFLEKHKHTFKQGISIETLQQILFNKGYLPYSVNAWINYIGYFSRSIGTRIHGSIISLSATTPTICVTHDSRTRELCQVMEIPSIPYSSINRENTIDEIFDQVTLNPETFNENRRKLAKQYQLLLAELGISESTSLNEIISERPPAKAK